MCAFCGRVPVRNGWPLTNGRWIEHNNPDSHNRKVEQYEYMENIKANKSSKGGLVSEKASSSENNFKDTDGHW